MLSSNVKKTIAIIDDDEDIINLYTSILTKEGYEVVSATTGVDGLKLITKVVPHLILLDITLPDTEGIDVLKLIKNEEHICNLPIVIITAHADSTYVQDAMKNGASDYILKTVDRSLALQKIHEHIKDISDFFVQEIKDSIAKSN